MRRMLTAALLMAVTPSVAPAQARRMERMLADLSTAVSAADHLQPDPAAR